MIKDEFVQLTIVGCATEVYKEPNKLFTPARCVESIPPYKSETYAQHSVGGQELSIVRFDSGKHFIVKHDYYELARIIWGQ